MDFYNTLIVVIIILIVLYLAITVYNSNYKKSELYIGSGLANNPQVFTSGATLRRMGQKFTSTNQGVYTTVHNMDKKGETKDVVVFDANAVPPELVSRVY